LRACPLGFGASATLALLLWSCAGGVAGAQEVDSGRADEPAGAPYIEFEDGHTGEIVRVPLEAEPAAIQAQPVEASPSGPSTIQNRERVDAAGPRSIRWLASGSPDCHRRGRRRICDGPLRVPEPSGDAMRLARSLELGERRVASSMLGRGPRDEWASNAGEAASRRLLYPVPGGRLGRGVGLTRRGRIRSRPHNGIDIGARAGTPVVAANPGLVIYSHNGLSGYGNLVMLVHSDATVTFYAHLRAAYVQPGQRVRRGETIGEVGSTGLATGPHLHFEWRRDGEPLDPLPHMDGLPTRRRSQ
jgi:murein DD-endopeptidase MepM/ murein hydrolase activator NlpD